MRIFIICFICLVFLQFAEAQDCFWQLSKNSYYVGDKFVATLVIPQVKLQNNPQLQTSDAFHFHFLEKNNVESDGKRTTLFRYQLIPLKSGAHMLPNVVFPGHKNLLCETQSLQIKVPEKNPNLKLDVVFSEKECCQHQPIDLIFTWKSAIPLDNIKAVNIDIPLFYHNEFKVFVPTYTANIEKNKIGLPVSGNRVIADIFDSKINNIPYKVISFRLTVIPEKAGVVEIEPATLLCSYIKEKSSFNTYPAYFDNNLFDQEDHASYKRLVAKSKNIRLKVKELPTTNQPANFSGLFGHFDANLKFNKNEIETGEPLQMQLEIKNYSHPDAFSLPNFESLLTDKKSFRYTKAEPMFSVSDSSVFAKKLIRVNTIDVEKFPSLEIPYFDLETEEYDFVKTSPVELQVLQGEEETEEILEDSVKTVPKIQIAENANGINQLFVGDKALRPDKRNRGVWFWLVLFIFPALYFPYSFFYNLYTNPEQVKKRRVKRSIRKFNQAKFKNEVEFEKNMTRFFQNAFNVENKFLLPQKIEDLIFANVQNVDIQPIINFYAEYFKKCYDKAEFQGTISTQRVKVCINQISKAYLKA